MPGIGGKSMKQVQFKRIISVLLTFAVLLTMVPVTFAASVSDFVDFPTGWSKEAMAFSVDNDLLNGKSANRIEPQAKLTRAEMATIINRAFGAKITKDISSYIDVKPSDWFYVEMQKAVNMQTFNGDGSGRLRPNDAITREEVMTVIARAMVLEQSDYSPLHKFSDFGQFSDWAKPYAAALVAGGYVNGVGNGKINPKVVITREEFAQLMYNIFKTYITAQGEYNSVTPNNCVMINQPNVTLKDVTIYGDLVIGDGVGSGLVNITNVTVKGRLLARGGNITLNNVTIGSGVVVKNVNGTTNFNNYKSEIMFNGVVEHTYTTYKQNIVSTGTGGSSGGSSGGGYYPGDSGSSTGKYTYTINYYYMDKDDIRHNIRIWNIDSAQKVTDTVNKNTTVQIPVKNVLNGYTYVFNAAKSSAVPGGSVVVSNNIAYHIYYDLQYVELRHPDGSKENVPVKLKETVREAVANLESQGLYEDKVVIDGEEYSIDWYIVDSQGNETKIDTEALWDALVPDGGYIKYKLRDENFYTVYFHDMRDTDPMVAFDTATINATNEESDRNIAFLNKTLDGIYAGRLGTLPAYNRNSIGYNKLDTEYTHNVDIEYLYEEKPGVWSVFTEDTIINSDIHVYYAAKHAVLDVTAPGLNLPYLGDDIRVFDVYYDSQSRFADSIKDILITMGSTLQKNEVKVRVDEKIGSIYEKLYAKTGMVDAEGNILDKDYGMKIIDVIDYDQIKGEVKLHVEKMLNGTPDDLKAIVSLIDIATLVDEIGGRELVNAIGVDSLRSMIKDDKYKSKALGYIIDKVTSDKSVISMVLNSDAKETLINSAADNDSFIIALIDNTTFQSKILGILKTEKKTQLLQYLGKDNLKTELISIIKKDSDFIDITANTEFIADITDTVKDSNEFKAILTGDGNYKKQIISQIKNDKLEDMVQILNGDSDFKKKMVEKVGEPGNTEAQMSQFAKDAKKAIMEVMNSKYPTEYGKISNVTNGYEAVVEYYVKGNCDSFPNIDFSRREFNEEFVPMINGVIDTVINEYFAYKNGDTSIEPDGYKVMNDYFNAEIDGIIEDVITAYVKGDYDAAAEGTSDYKIKKFIDDELAAHIKKAISDYVNPDVTMDAEIRKLIDDTLIGLVKDYLNSVKNENDGKYYVNGVKLNDNVVTIIESNIISFLKDYFSGNSTLAGDQEIDSLAAGIKTEFIKKIKNAKVDEIEGPIAEFVIDDANYGFVKTFVTDNYGIVVDSVDATFINTYINTMSDNDLDELVKEFADTDMIVEHIVKLEEKDRIELANNIVKFLDNYKPFVEFMDAFKNKRATFEVNYNNIHFVTAVGNAIYGFDFDEILEILKSKGFDQVIQFVGEDVVKDIFNASKENYWKGLEPVIEAVKADKVPREYTTSMSITINVPLILEALYDNNANKFIEKIVNTDIYDYDKNTSLKKLVNIDWFDMFIGYDATRVDEATGATGYYIRDYMEYYTAVLDTLILFDQALCFYNRADYDDAEMVEVKKSLTKDIIRFLKELESISDKIENGEAIYGGFTLNALINKVDSLNKVVDSLGKGALAGKEGAIETVVNNIKSILENLGQGNLPAGYTLDDLNALAQKLVTVIEGMNESEYDSVNDTFNDVIESALNKLDSILNELDANGTIAGKPLDAMFSKISVLNGIYNKFSSQIKSIISAVADVDFGSLDIEADIEKYEDIIFGREEDDIFNIDSIVNLVKDRFTNDAVSSGYYDKNNGYYVIDDYSKTIKDIEIFFQRIFY